MIQTKMFKENISFKSNSWKIELPSKFSFWELLAKKISSAFSGDQRDNRADMKENSWSIILFAFLANLWQKCAKFSQPFINNQVTRKDFSKITQHDLCDQNTCK